MIDFRVMAGIKRDNKKIVDCIVSETGAKVYYDDLDNTYHTAHYTALIS